MSERGSENKKETEKKVGPRAGRQGERQRKIKRQTKKERAEKCDAGMVFRIVKFSERPQEKGRATEE